MTANPKLSSIASLIADPSRSKMLGSLLNLDGLPATELSRLAGVRPQTASSHLKKMVKAGLLKVEVYGRHRYYSIASEEVAKVLESLARIAPFEPPKTTRESREIEALKQARTCYRHLAGSLGVAIYDHCLKTRLIRSDSSGLKLTAKGERFFGELGIELASLRAERRSLILPCLDWTERRHHLAGSLGQGIADLFFRKKWLVRIAESRAVRLSEAGEMALRNILQIQSINRTSRPAAIAHVSR